MFVCTQVNVGSLYFTFGGISKLIATIVTYPVQVLQTRSRVCHHSELALYLCFVLMIESIQGLLSIVS